MTMYQLFNVLAWIWIVVVGLLVINGTCFFLYRLFYAGWDRVPIFDVGSFGELYGYVWIAYLLVCVVALTVDFNPKLQVWVIIVALAAALIRAFNVTAFKVTNS